MSVNSTSPATLFGGTWTQLKDKFLLGAGDTYKAGSTGGEATHKLTSGESGLMEHFHKGLRWAAENGTRISLNGGSGIQLSFSSGGDAASDIYTSKCAAKDASKAHNNMPPYLAVYMWKRTA